MDESTPAAAENRSSESPSSPKADLFSFHDVKHRPRTAGAWVFLAVCCVFGLLLGISTIVRDAAAYLKCDNEIGSLTIWSQVYLKLFYKDGFFQPAKCNFDFVTTLDLSHLGLSELPSGVSVLVNLQNLDVSYNALVTLPTSLAYMQQLQVLNVAGNPVAFSLVNKT